MKSYVDVAQEIMDNCVMLTFRQNYRSDTSLLWMSVSDAVISVDNALQACMKAPTLNRMDMIESARIGFHVAMSDIRILPMIDPFLANAIKAELYSGQVKPNIILRSMDV